MTFSIKSSNIYNLMRQCGYSPERQEETELAFSRVVGPSRSGYPRFHIYLKKENVSGETLINLHLDQKRPVYKGTPAHAGEYEGDLVEKEAERIKKISQQ